MPDLIRRLPRRRHPRLVRDLRFKHFLAFGVGSACPFRYLVWIVVQGFSAGSPSSPYFFYQWVVHNDRSSMSVLGVQMIGKWSLL